MNAPVAYLTLCIRTSPHACTAQEDTTAWFADRFSRLETVLEHAFAQAAHATRLLEQELDAVRKTRDELGI